MTNKENQNKEYFIYIKRTKQRIPVSKEVYLNYYRPIWAIQKRAQEHGKCFCTKFNLWKCDGDCIKCKYQAQGDAVSLDKPLNNEGFTLADTLEDKAKNIQEILEDTFLLEELLNVLSELNANDRKICEAILHNKSLRKAAESLGLPWTSFKNAWNHLKPQLFERLKDFI